MDSSDKGLMLGFQSWLFLFVVVLVFLGSDSSATPTVGLDCEFATPAEFLHSMVDPTRRLQFTLEQLKASHGYERLLERVKPGDILVFPEGHSFKVKKQLSNPKVHGYTYVFELDDGTALRVDRDPENSVKNGAEGMRAVYQEFVDEGVPMMRIHHPGMKCSGCVQVEKLNMEFTLKDLFRIEKKGGMDPAFVQKVWADLDEFARKTAQYESIWDFNSAQLGYVRDRGWVLFDYGGVAKRFDPKASNIEEDLFSEDYYRFTVKKTSRTRHLKQVIRDERVRRGLYREEKNIPVKSDLMTH